MSKGFKNDKQYTMLRNLEKVWKLKNEYSQIARSQLDYFIRNGYLTAMMKREASRIIQLNWEQIKTKRRLKRHYLYAVSDGEYIKIGMSCRVDQRIKTLQTASPRPLKKVWACYAGEDDKQARKQEQKLHRALKRHAVSGEWFDKDCMKIVEGWRVRSLEAKQEEEAEKINNELDAEFASIIL